MIPKENLTICFSGHNIREYADVAIRSFLLHYPELHDRIYYFDDNSTDTTVKLLEDLKVHRLTWDTELKQLYNDYFTNGTIKNMGQSQMLRCEFILKSIMKQCTTKYLLTLDGDTVTLRRGFVEEYFANHIDVYGVDGWIHTPYHRLSELDNNLYSEQYCALAMESIPITGDAYCTYPHIRHERVHTCTMLLNLEKLTKHYNYLSILNDTDYIDLFDDDVIDVGSDILLQCRKNGLTESLIRANNEEVFHWAWVSSSIRDKDNTCNLSSEYVLKVYQNHIRTNSCLRNALKQLGVRPYKLFEAIASKIRTGDYNET